MKKISKLLLYTSTILFMVANAAFGMQNDPPSHDAVATTTVKLAAPTPEAALSLDQMLQRNAQEVQEALTTVSKLPTEPTDYRRGLPEAITLGSQRAAATLVALPSFLPDSFFGQLDVINLIQQYALYNPADVFYDMGMWLGKQGQNINLIEDLRVCVCCSGAGLQRLDAITAYVFTYQACHQAAAAEGHLAAAFFWGRILTRHSNKEHQQQGQQWLQRAGKYFEALELLAEYYARSAQEKTSLQQRAKALQAAGQKRYSDEWVITYGSSLLFERARLGATQKAAEGTSAAPASGPSSAAAAVAAAAPASATAACAAATASSSK